MSQQLTPINGGVVPEVQTTTAPDRLKVLSPQYIEAKKLQSRPTEWTAGGRPIYRRLPATSETYQIDFFNIVNESNIVGNTSVKTKIERVGYVYIPYGLSIDGSASIQVVAAQDNKGVMIKAGEIVWAYGKVKVLPTLVNFEVLDVLDGKYDLAYELIYDDSPVPHLYEVSDFALTGIPFNITSSTDSVTGWRYPGVNAFLNESNRFWSNEDSIFPTYAQPTQSYLQWEGTLPHAYKTIVLRCPPGTSYPGTASLSYVNGTTLSPVATASIESDSAGQFFQINIEEPVLQTGWNVTFSSTLMSIQSITVSGAITQLEPQAGASPRAALTMYPAGTLPPMVENAQGEMVPATYCTLAQIDIGVDQDVIKIVDTRNIIHRDYVPVADWLTLSFDENLIDLYEQVSGYSGLWMNPSLCMRQEYVKLSTSQVEVVA